MPSIILFQLRRALPAFLFLGFVFCSAASTWGNCDKALDLYSKRSFDKAIELAYTLLADLDSSIDNRICAYKVLGISYYAKGDVYMDSVEFYMKGIVQLDPHYVFDPDDNWPPFCRNLIYKYQREWRETHPSSLPPEISTLAVLPFENRSVEDRKKLDPLREGFADILITDLSKIINLKIVERERLQSLLTEMGINQSSIVDDKTAVQVGKIEGAQLILFGSFLKLDKKHVRVDARIIKTETAELVKAEKIEGNPNDLLELINQLALKVAQHLIVAISAIEKKKIEELTERSWDAVLLYSEGLRLQDQGEYKNACKKFEKALKIDPEFLEAKKKFHNLQPLVK